jgi:hypothetical protein
MRTICVAIGLLLMLGWPGTTPVFAERASEGEQHVGDLPEPLGNTSKAVLLCDRRTSERPLASLVERAFEKGRVMPISSYDDDPFVQDSVVECMAPSGFDQGPDGRLILANARTSINDEIVIYRQDLSGDEEQGEFRAFATNPWPCVPLPSDPGFCAPPAANADGSFRFLDEPRFPLFTIERGADGKPILRDGLQVWTPNDLHRGMTTTFEAANKAKYAAEDWSGRALSWGIDGVLFINTHAFIDFNAFYSPAARQLFFGVVPYRLPPTPTTPIRMFEMASGWEIAAHESGHAVHHTLKPNVDNSDFGFRTWSESFADQFAMWTSLRDPGRVRSLLAATNGDLSSSNALSRTGEAFGALTGGAALRDAVNDATVSTTFDEVHDRSETLTGGLYRVFLSIYGDLKRQNRERALEEAGAILGTFLTGTTDYTPENTPTLEDVGKAYLKVDKEFFGGRYYHRLVDELTRREIFNADSVAAWLAHEAAVPHLRLHGRSAEEVDALVQTNLDRLGIGPDFGLVVQSATRENQHGQTIVRVQLTLGRGAGAVLLDNHGVLVFRADGRLADYHAPLPSDVGSHALAMALIDHGRRLGLDRRGAPLSIVRTTGGQMTVEARVLRGDRLNVWLEAFTVANPHGERREVVSRSWATGAKATLLKRAGTILTTKQLEE